MQQKRIAVVTRAFHGHLTLEMEDGTKQMVFRGQHEEHAPKVGDMWPPDGHEHGWSGNLLKSKSEPIPLAAEALRENFIKPALQAMGAREADAAAPAPAPAPAAPTVTAAQETSPVVD